ncbi:putative disease resistance protein RGA1 isoform X2 [Silene latifolia]
MFSKLGYKSELLKLQQTVSTTKAVIEDAEAKQGLSMEEQLYIDELKDEVFDADDVFDEFNTFVEQKELVMEDGKFSKKVCFLFRHLNRSRLGNMSSRIKNVRNKLDDITSNHSKFGFDSEGEKFSKCRREESSSFVYAADIIGREADVKNIVRLLLNPDVKEDISFLSIVGIGGLGKTALAQCVFNDERVSSAFPVKLWTCVSDHHEDQLNLESILVKILESATGRKPELGTSLENVQKRLCAYLAGKRFILVLDDVWNENRDELIKLAVFLTGGRSGSWVLVTTRSKETARVIGKGLTYELQGLSEENSWKLFERMTFGLGTLPDELVQIGKDIVKCCANVPLAIRVIGSLLYGQPKCKWVSFQQKALPNICSFENNSIMHILKFSYHDLKSSLKSCFKYCALFPKDFEIDKDTLIGLWMAQGYITPSKSGQSIEDVAEDYFFTLLNRCFFQDVKKDEYGEILSCKVHDLMHDIAQKVSAKEICEVNSNTLKVSKSVRHIAVRGHKFMDNCSTKTNIRTYLQVSKVGGMLLVEHLLANCPSLRTLDLRGAVFEVLPNSIGKLVHLRYLDLSFNVKLKLLPKSITRLHNLQTLNLLGCRGLVMLPKGLSKLVKLRVLDVKDCFLPLYMPPDFGRLTCLQKLDRFGMGDVNPTSKKRFDQLKDLMSLVNLKGSLGIQIRSRPIAPYHSDGGAYLSTLEHLSGVEIWYLRSYIREEFRKETTVEYDMATIEYEEAILEDLRPHSNLKYLRLVEYNGGKLPAWAREHNLATFLPNLVRIELKECLGLDHLPWIGLLRCLKFLRLEILPSLEYLMNAILVVDSVPGSSTGTLSLFPCLEHLYLENLPKLKGWWPSSNPCEINSRESSPYLPRLKGLWIYECPKMAFIPLCPLVDDLRIYDANRSLELKTLDSNSSTCPAQMRVATGNVELLRLVPMENFQCLKEMRIESDYKLKNLSEVEDLFRNCLSSLQVLEIWRCPKLGSLSGGLEHLTLLQRLHIRKTAGLLTNDEHGGVPWRCLAQTLKSLRLEDLPHLVNLPNGMHHLTSLESLSIVDCKGLTSFPEWMPELTSLKKLEVRRGCAELKGRCRNVTGQDWLNIQHICDILIEE